MTSLARAIARYPRRDDGQGLAEYALILALICLGSQLSTILSTVGSSV
jgi:Flp pilus assembly pilin Flp